MHLPRCLLPIGLLLCSLALPAAAADASTSPAGYWAGTITLPNQELDMSVELTAAGEAAWQGTIDIPTQGMRGFKLDPLKIVGPAIEFGLPGIPGEPYFTGKVAADGQTLAGSFSQGGGVFPFRLERKPKPAPDASEAVPAAGVPGEGLIGNWRGAISPLPNIQLRLELELKADAAGKPDGVLISLDQGKPRLPISNLTETDGTVTFDTPSVNGQYRGTLKADGAEIVGEWTQNGRTTPLVFKRLPAKTP